MVISENTSENLDYDADTRIHYIMQNYALVMLANIDSSFHSERAQLTSNQSSTKTHIGEANRVYRYKNGVQKLKTVSLFKLHRGIVVQDQLQYSCPSSCSI